MITSSLNRHSQEFLPIDGIAATKLASLADRSKTDLNLEFVSAKQWDCLASEFADIIPEQMGSFNTGHWGEDNLEFLTFRQKSKLVGGAVMIVRTIPISGTGIALLKWGPVCQKLGSNFDAVLYKNIINSLKAEYCLRRNFHLTIMPLAKPATAEQCQEILPHLGFELGRGFAAPERYIVNVQDTAETLMASLDQKWRYNLRKSLKNEFEIRIVDLASGLHEFMDLYKQMVDRKKFHDSSAIDALEQIMKDSPAETRPIVVLVSHDGKVTAGGVFHVVGNMASYMFGATDARALKLKAGYALHWWVAEYLCKKPDIDWYDLGGNDLDKGLHQFKKGFVGKLGHILTAPSRYHFSCSLPAKFIGFAAFQVRDAVSSISRRFHALNRNN